METTTETYRAAEELPVSSDVVETLVGQRVGPGILLFSVSLQLMHVNPRAWELSRKIMQVQNGKTATGVLPRVITELCAEVIAELQVRTNAKDWEQVQLRRLVSGSEPPVLLRALGLPDRGGLQQARILILLEEVSPRKARAPEQARELFRLTTREHGVVSYLAKGHTNKEIANALKISEQTVKEHIKHIMEKTGSTTRTGILARIFNS
ncbi:MAG: helix-turn-helix transcriptional regulator [Nitrospirae bacterium]|nr:MAG: helix-turn-helix transcriptional regulator [Nitrospirota bacterium]